MFAFFFFLLSTEWLNKNQLLMEPHRAKLGATTSPGEFATQSYASGLFFLTIHIWAEGKTLVPLIMDASYRSEILKGKRLT